MTRVFSMFTGIGGFEMGLLMSGKQVRLVGFSEVDKYAIEIFEKQFKGVNNYGNATTIDETKLPDFDLLVGGFPCQAFSVAGKLRGFNDTRGTLFFDVARILKHKKPKHFILENVRGLLSHDSGRTFQTILKVLSDIGYMVQWEVCNSKNYGVPQNRERVYIVGHLRGRSRPQVFPITKVGPKDNQNNHPKEITKDMSMAYRVYDTDGVSTTLRAVGGGVGAKTGLYQIVKRSGKVKADQKNASCLTGGARGDGNHSYTDWIVQDGVMVTEATKKGYAVAEEGDSINLSVPNSKTRRGRVGKQVAQTLDTGMQQYTIQTGVEVRACLTPDRLNKRQNGRRFKDNEEPMFTLTGQDKHGVMINSSIRRLTPLECERLQGFPDGWTEGVSDTQRYKCLGNAVTTNVVCEIAKRLLK